MTDIVERAKEHLCPEGAVCSDCEMLREAVAEIERLRAVLRRIADLDGDEWQTEWAREALRHD